jgi:hypothetical protein
MTKTEIASILRYEALRIRAISSFKTEIEPGDFEKRAAALIAAADLLEENP